MLPWLLNLPCIASTCWMASVVEQNHTLLSCTILDHSACDAVGSTQYNRDEGRKLKQDGRESDIYFKNCKTPGDVIGTNQESQPGLLDVTFHHFPRERRNLFV